MNQLIATVLKTFTTLFFKQVLLISTFLLILLSTYNTAEAQCTFSTDASEEFRSPERCATPAGPKEVWWRFRYINAAIDPAVYTVQYVFEWLPTATVTVLNATQVLPGEWAYVNPDPPTFAGATFAPSFLANEYVYFQYPANLGVCTVTPRVSLRLTRISNGAITNCTASGITKNTTYWDTDRRASGALAIADNMPAGNVIRVCAGEEVEIERKRNGSTFNCVGVTDANNGNRWIQWVYNTNGATTVANAQVLADAPNYFGGIQTLNPAGYSGQLVGPVVLDAGPKNNPGNNNNLNSNRIRIPATATPGQQITVTMRTWNPCNPYDDPDIDGGKNGNLPTPDAPDWAAEEITYQILVIAKATSTVTVRRTSDNAIASNFCPGDVVRLRATAAAGGGLGGYQYRWDIFDGPTDAARRVRRVNNNQNPDITATLNPAAPNVVDNNIFRFTGEKLVRLTIIPTTGFNSGACNTVIETNFNIIQTAAALIETDGDSNVEEIHACVSDASISFIFRDISSNKLPTTSTSWQVRRISPAAQTLFSVSQDGATAFDPAELNPFYFTGLQAGHYRVTLSAAETGSGCTTTDVVNIFIYDDPAATYDNSSVCAGSVDGEHNTLFNTISNANFGISPQVNGDVVNLWEWDFSYDSVTLFNVQRSVDNNNQFRRFLNSADDNSLPSEPGLYNVALRVTTVRGCQALFVRQVRVNHNPVASLTSDYTVPICPGESLTFTNTSNEALNDISIGAVTYRLVIRDLTTNITNDTISIGGQGATRSFSFVNPSATDIRDYEISIRAIGANSCVVTSPVQTVSVNPGAESDFIARYVSNGLPYSVIGGNNCSDLAMQFTVGGSTTVLAPDSYRWTVRDNLGNIMPGTPETFASTVTTFNYTFRNDFDNDNSIVQKNFTVELTPLKAGTCIGTSTQLIRVDPKPSSEFTITLIEDDCDVVIYELDAIQKGLQTYTWSFNPTQNVPRSNLALTADRNRIRVAFDREPFTGVDYKPEITLVTRNPFNCDSDATTKEPLADILKKVDPATNVVLTSTQAVSNVIEACEPQFIANFTNETNLALIPQATYSLEVKNSAGIDIFNPAKMVDGDATPDGDLRGPFTYEFNTPGRFMVRLIATDPTGCQVPSDPPIEVNIYPRLVVNFNLATQGCSGTYSLVANVPTISAINGLPQSSVPINLTWDVFNPITNSTNSVTGSFAALNSVTRDLIVLNTAPLDSYDFEITLRATSIGGCTSAPVTKIIKVFKQPQVAFAVLDNPLCEDYELEFDIAANNNPVGTTYRYDFGDGSSNTATTSTANVSKNYVNRANFNGPDNYTVRLTATTPDNCSVETTQVVTLHPRVAAAFFSNTQEGCSPLSVSLNSTSQGVRANTTVEWFSRRVGEATWNLFSSNQGSATTVLTNTSGISEEYEIRLLLTTVEGCESERISSPIEVFSSFASDAIQNTNTQVCAGQNGVVYSINNPTPGSTYGWSVAPVVVGSGTGGFVTSTTASTATVNFLPQSGLVRISVIETNILGCSGTPAVLDVTVNALPTATISGSANICNGSSAEITFNLGGVGPFDVVYRNLTTSLNTTLNGISNGHTIQVSPTVTTNYTLVSVTDSNNPNCSNTNVGSNNVLVNVLPLPTLTVSGNRTICEGESAVLTFNLGGNGPWEFDFQDNQGNLFLNNSSSSNVVNFTVSPPVTTTYTLLAVRDNFGCQRTVLPGSVVITVNERPAATLSGNQVLCRGDVPTLRIQFNEGIAPFRVRYTDGTLTYTLPEVFPNGSGEFTFSPPIPSVSTIYELVDVRDSNNPNCLSSAVNHPTDVNGQANVVVNQLPTSALSTIQSGISTTSTICVGDTQRLYFSFVGNGPFIVTYTERGVPIQITINQGEFIEVSPSLTSQYRITAVRDANNPTCVGSNFGETVTVNVNPLPSGTMSALSSAVCENGSTKLLFNFTGNGPWNFQYSDGVTTFNRTATTPEFEETVSPAATTTYTLLQVQDINGCIITPNTSLVLTINPLPIATLAGSGEFCQGTEVELILTTTGTGPWNYAISNGGLPNLTGNFTAAQASLAGGVYTYLVRFTPPAGNVNHQLISLEDTNTGCFAINSGQSASVLIYGIPSISLSANTQVCAGDDAQITFNIQGGFGPYDLVLNDGNQNIPFVGVSNGHVFTQAISQTTTFTVVSLNDRRLDSNGNLLACPALDLGSPVTIISNARPVAVLSGNQNLCFGDDATLTVTTTGSAPFTIVYTDGIQEFTINNATASQAIQVSPQVPTTYSLVSVSDANNPVCLGTVSGTSNIIVYPELIPDFIVKLSDNVTEGVQQEIPNRRFFFTNTTNSIDNWTYRWEFGDGRTSTNRDVTIEYPTFGSYTVTLTAENAECREVVSKVVKIIPKRPIAAFSYTPDEGCIPVTVTFTNESQFADPSRYRWDFGDGSAPSTAINPVHTYRTPGLYTVTLTATNPSNEVAIEIKRQIIEVFPAPIADFAVAPTQVFLPEQPIYTRNDSRNAVSFLWNFGDGTTSESYEPVHLYKEPGTYDVTLIATNSLGCTDTLTLVAAVTAQEGGQVRVPNVFTPGVRGGSGGTGGAGFGDNSLFLPITDGVVEFEMLIFNRWGELIFESRDRTKGWDGYHKGRLCPQDVYVYKLKVKMESGEILTKIGDLTLLR